MGTTSNKRVEGVPCRHLNRPHRLDPERLAAGFLAQRGDVLQRHLGVEATGEHAIVVIDKLVRDVDVAQLQARKLGLVGVGLRV